MSIINTRQITKANNKTKLVEFNDNLQPNDLSEKSGEIKSTVHNKFSRIGVTIVDWSKGKKDKATVLNHNLIPATAKAIAEQVIIGNKNLFSRQGFAEQKIDFYKKDESGFSPISAIQIQYQQQMNNPWTITINSGKGIAIRNQNGGIAIKKGSYKKLSSSMVVISEIDMLIKMTELRDYIASFETCHMNYMLKNRTKFEQKLKREREAQQNEEYAI